MGNLDIFPLILMSDIFSNKELTLILTIIIPSDVKHIIMSPMKSITSDLKVVTYIITQITARPIRLTKILAIMSVSTFKTDFILYITHQDQRENVQITHNVWVFFPRVNISEQYRVGIWEPMRILFRANHQWQYVWFVYVRSHKVS
jgi:hypothetical protein